MPTEPLNSRSYLIFIKSLWRSTTILIFQNTELRHGAFSNLARIDLIWSLPAEIWSRISVPQPEIEVRPQQWEHWSCPVASEKVLSSRRCNKIWQNRWKILKTVNDLFIEGRRVRLDTHRVAQRESCTLLVWIPYVGCFFQVPSDQSPCFAELWVCVGCISRFSPTRTCIS